MSLTRRDLILGTAAAGVVAALPAHAAATQTLGGPAFGSIWRAVVPAGADPAPLRAAVERIVVEFDAAMSPYRADSELTRFNRAGAGWQPVSPETSAAAALALTVSDETGGAFDPTIGPLVRRFGFGPIAGRPGTSADIVTAPGALGKESPGPTLDLCGLAKGQALDRVVAALPAAGIADALVELGGEVRTLGRHPEGRAWQVGVERPGEAPLAFQRIVAPGGLALATSGRTPQGYSDGGRNLAHIIDPRTSRPATNDLLAVTVLAPTAAQADALSTALMVLGREEGAALSRRRGWSALFLSRRAGRIRETMTGAFDRHLVA